MEELENDGAAEKSVDQAETFTKDEFEEMLKARIEERDKELNAKFQKQFAELKKEKEGAVKSKEEFEVENRKMIEEMRLENKREKLLAQSIKAYSLAGIDVPDDEVLLDMIRVDSDDPLRVVNYNIDTSKSIQEKTKTAAADEFVRKSGRKVVDTKPGTWDGLTYKDIASMPKEEFNRIPADVVERITDAALK